MTSEWNFVLLLSVTVLYASMIGWKLSIRQVDILLGYLCGLVYFLICPIWVLWFLGTFEANKRTKIPNIAWETDSESMQQLLWMLLALAPMVFIINRFARLNRQPEEGQKSKPKIGSSHRFRILKIWHIWVIFAATTVIEFKLAGLGESGAHWAGSRQDLMSDQGSFAVAFLLFCACIRYALLFALLGEALAGKSRYYLLIGIFVIGVLYSTGVRITVAQTGVVIFLCCIANRKFTVPTTMVASALPLLLAMLMFTAVRSQMHDWKSFSFSGATTAFANSIKLASDYYSDKISLGETAFGLTEASSLCVFVAVEKTYPERDQFLYGKTLVKPFLFWIPRSIWPKKPVNFPTLIGSRLVRPGVSLSSTAMGEPYANFGIFGFLYAPLAIVVLSRLIKAIDFNNSGDLTAYASLILGFTITRNGMIEVAFPLLSAFLICSLLLRSGSPSKRTIFNNGEPRDGDNRVA